MIPLARLPLVVVLDLIAVTAVGLIFSHWTPAQAALSPALFLVVAIEFLVYLLGAVLSNPSIGPGRGSVFSLLMVAMRLILSLPAGLLMVGTREMVPAEAFLRAWVGNPVGALLQAFVLMLLAPHVLMVLAPGLITERMQSILEGNQERQRPSNPPAGVLRDMSPVGGFIQVFSFDELQSLFWKSAGMEGFVLYTAEGLVLWKDIPLRLDADSLVARTLPLTDSVAATMEGFGMAQVRKLLVESREHHLFCARLNGNFGLLMIFAGTASMEDSWARLGLMANTTREFLQWKYPTLRPLRRVHETPAPAGA